MNLLLEEDVSSVNNLIKSTDISGSDCNIYNYLCL